MGRGYHTFKLRKEKEINKNYKQTHTVLEMIDDLLIKIWIIILYTEKLLLWLLLNPIFKYINKIHLRETNAEVRRES